jgi:cobalamin biosynthesis protein CbiG
MAALASAGRELAEVQALYAPEVRRDAPALRAAALRLGKPLEFLAMELLLQQRAGALTQSERVQQGLGLPSAAETAALAGACGAQPAASARLLGPRSIAGAATCALAIVEAR